jgi:hypothetical protein
MAALREKPIAEGCEASAIDRIKRAAAGLDLGAITPEEIAMSIPDHRRAKTGTAGGGAGIGRASKSALVLAI